MNTHKQTIYYNKLSKLSAKPLFLFFSITLLLFVAEIYVIYAKVIPSILMLIKEDCPFVAIDMISRIFSKLIYGLIFWGFMFFIMNIALICVIVNIQKYFKYQENVAPSASAAGGPDKR